MTTVTVADGTTFEVDPYDADAICGAVRRDGILIPLGKVERPDAYVALTPCCFESKTSEHVVPGDEDYPDGSTYIVCGGCGETVEDHGFYGGFLHVVDDLLPRI